MEVRSADQPRGALDPGGRRGRRLRWVLVAGLLALAGCGRDSTTGPRQSGLIIEAQELVPDGSGCRLKVTLRNRIGAEVSGQLVYNLLDVQRVVVGSGTVFPRVPDNTTRSATSDLLKASADSHLLACSEIAVLEVNPAQTTVPLAS